MTHNHTVHNIGIASQIGSYSDAVEVGAGHRWLHISGTPGLSKNGNMPDNIKEQTELAWDNIMQLLKAADMDVEDIVKITQYLTRTDDIPEYSKTRKAILAIRNQHLPY